MNDLRLLSGAGPEYILSYSVFRPIRRHILNNLTKSIARYALREMVQAALA